MSYQYEVQRGALFTDDGQRMFLAIRDHVLRTLKTSGAITMGAAMSGATTGDSWQMMACVDRMIELGEIREIDQGDVAGQFRVFVPSRRTV